MPAQEALPPAALPVAPVDGVLLEDAPLDGELLEDAPLDGELLDGELLDGELLEGVLLEELELVSLLPLPELLLPALPPYEPLLLCDQDAVAKPIIAAATAALIALDVMTWISSRVGRGTAQAATQEQCLASPAVRPAGSLSRVEKCGSDLRS